jgi:hypothetical protein
MKISISIDLGDVLGKITFIERDFIPNLKSSYSKKFKEFIFKS